MTLSECLTPLSKRCFFNLCGVTYTDTKRYKDYYYDELPPSIQLGFKKIISQLFVVQKLSFRYDIDHTAHSLKICGVKLQPFFKKCNVPDSFYSTKYIKKSGNEETMWSIRIQILEIINDIFLYIRKRP